MSLETLKKGKFNYSLTSKEERLAQFISYIISKGIVLTLAVLFYFGRVLARLLFKLKRWLYRVALVILLVNSVINVLNITVYAPKAEAVLNGKKPMVVHTDLKVKEIVLSMARYEYGEDQVKYINYIISNESGFDPKAVNPNGGACGLFQSLPCNKMLSMSLQDQIQFGFNYINNRYGSPKNAWDFWKVNRWY